MTSFRQFGEDFGTWYQLDEVDELAVSVWGQGTAYLTRAEVAELRDHLNDVLAADPVTDSDNDIEAIEESIDLTAAEARGYARAIAVLRDDYRYRNWWTADGAWQHEPTGRYWSPAARGHLADYLETIDKPLLSGETYNDLDNGICRCPSMPDEPHCMCPPVTDHDNAGEAT